MAKLTLRDAHTPEVYEIAKQSSYLADRIWNFVEERAFSPGNFELVEGNWLGHLQVSHTVQDTWSLMMDYKSVTIFWISVYRKGPEIEIMTQVRAIGPLFSGDMGPVVMPLNYLLYNAPKNKHLKILHDFQIRQHEDGNFYFCQFQYNQAEGKSIWHPRILLDRNTSDGWTTLLRTKIKVQ